MSLFLFVSVSCVRSHLPVETAATSPFGFRLRDSGPDIHHGIDLGAAAGTPVKAVLSGRVRFAGEMGAFGNVVWIDHRGRVTTIYAHLSRIDVKAGTRIEGGSVLGLSGSTGNALGAHLHFEVRRRGRAINPRWLISHY